MSPQVVCAWQNMFLKLWKKYRRNRWVQLARGRAARILVKFSFINLFASSICSLLGLYSRLLQASPRDSERSRNYTVRIDLGQVAITDAIRSFRSDISIEVICSIKHATENLSSSNRARLNPTKSSKSVGLSRISTMDSPEITQGCTRYQVTLLAHNLTNMNEADPIFYIKNLLCSICQIEIFDKTLMNWMQVMHSSVNDTTVTTAVFYDKFFLR
jgi:hypothetical protein